VSQFEKSKAKLLAGTSDHNFDFDEFVSLIKKLGFRLRTGKGSHRHVCSKEGIPMAISIQPRDGNKAKHYQVRQIREIVIHYNL
jgi:predicted RNA binding protein YcfA (HicA-like mRNA interferase family)